MHLPQRSRFAVSAVAVLLAAAGCGPARPARIPAPPLDPAAVAGAALGGAGPLAAVDLAKVPALAAALPLLDTDGDKKLSRDELVAWLTEVRDSKVAITSLAVEVKHKGRALQNAEVRFVPEAFMTSVKPAEGTTDDSGMTMVSIPGSEYPGVNCGLYRVEITGQGNDGKPLAAKYNTATTLGVAVGGMLPENGMVSYVLE
jgi:hypothetical protein